MRLLQAELALRGMRIDEVALLSRVSLSPARNYVFEVRDGEF